MSTPFYVTTPLYYPNADPHLGSAYTTTYADTLARYHRLRGEESIFLTGTDEHGEKMAQAAAESGVEPEVFVDRMAERFRVQWRALELTPDRFIRTTDDDHVRAVQHFWQGLYDAGEVEFREYTGLYCVGCEAFMTPTELVDGCCSQHLRPPEPRSESNYFFKMSDYFEWLRDELESHPDLITPPRFKNEVLGMIGAGGLQDLCITRPVERLSWGVPAPWDAGYVIYVWADALVNYLTGVGYPDDPAWKQRWSGVHHLIGKDILKAHGVFWPTMLRAAGIPLYRGLHVHGHWLLGSQKISKSATNLADALGLKDRYGFEAGRYYILRDMPFGQDTEFSEEGLVRRLNADLANNLGNLVSRSLGMIERYFDGVVPESHGPSALRAAAERAARGVEAGMRAFSTRDALEALFELVGAANRYIEEEAPWKLAKDPAQRERLATVLHETLEAVRVVAILLSPFMPQTAAKILERLGAGAVDSTLVGGTGWGALAAGARVAKGEPLFPRVEPE
jgi:methionyl-tRNA synthetase